MTSRREMIEQLHAGRTRLVLVVTGGGSRAISDLLTVPGASRTLLDAAIPYSPAALEDWLGFAPEGSCRRETALSMASVAWWKARRLSRDSGTGPDGCLGVACTASLVSDRPKRGEHRCWIAAESAEASSVLSLTLHRGTRDRAGEEDVVADLILFLTGLAAGLESPPQPELRPDETLILDQEILPPLLAGVRSGRTPVIWSLPDGRLVESPAEPPVGLLSGSFHPLHHGHLRLRQVAEDVLGGPVCFELPVVNADKPPLDGFDLEARRAQFTEHPLALTSAPLFSDKARLFPGATFVVGFDTAERILQPRFYSGSVESMHRSLEAIGSLGCRFLVAGRRTSDGFHTLADLPVPRGLADLFSAIPESHFREDISSTELRHQTCPDPDSSAGSVRTAVFRTR